MLSVNSAKNLLSETKDLLLVLASNATRLCSRAPKRRDIAIDKDALVGVII